MNLLGSENYLYGKEENERTKKAAQKRFDNHHIQGNTNRYHRQCFHTPHQCFPKTRAVTCLPQTKQETRTGLDWSHIFTVKWLLVKAFCTSVKPHYKADCSSALKYKRIDYKWAIDCSSIFFSCVWTGTLYTILNTAFCGVFTWKSTWHWSLGIHRMVGTLQQWKGSKTKW